MLITINIPDTLPGEKLRQRISEIEKIFGYDATIFEATKKTEKKSEKDDPWSNPDAELPSVDTGIEDLSINHDRYLYGATA